jgi:hypothetical protein
VSFLSVCQQYGQNVHVFILGRIVQRTFSELVQRDDCASFEQPFDDRKSTSRRGKVQWRGQLEVGAVQLIGTFVDYIFDTLYGTHLSGSVNWGHSVLGANVKSSAGTGHQKA